MKKKQVGAYLVMMAILIIVLIGIAALAIDVGRLLVLRTDMQNAADAASLAAASQLTSDSGAQERAKSAARELLEHSGRFARVVDLLGSQGLPDEAFEFYCVIGSESDVSEDDPGFEEFCSGDEVEPGKYAATSDVDSHYVRVTLDPVLVGDGDRFTSDLIFLPVLGALGLDVAQTAEVAARALAGRNFFTCNYPPMAMCDPWEGTGSHFREEMEVGGHIEMRQQGSNQWSSGNFGFLQPPNAGPGANDVSEFIANEDKVGCNPPTFTTQTGSMTAKTRAGWNTRLDIYNGPAPFQSYSSEWPPAPNVVGYPLDDGSDSIDSRIGNGNWDFDSYWNDEHSGAPKPNGWSNSSLPTRHEVYQHEIENSLPDSGDPTNPAGPPSRRVMTMAVLSCEALGITGGKKSGVVFPQDGFARMFIVKPAEGPPDVTFYGEYLGWAEETDANYHVDVQLYE